MTYLKTMGISILQLVAVTLLCLGLIFTFLYPFTVSGISMEGAMRDGDMVYGIRMNILPQELNRGDIVTISKELYGEEAGMVKRIIGLPGDFVQVSGNAVYVNGQLLEEEYLTLPTTMNWGEPSVMLEEGEYFVLGDNRDFSGDSREYGPVTHDEITSKVFLRTGNKIQGLVKLSVLN